MSRAKRGLIEKYFEKVPPIGGILIFSIPLLLSFVAPVLAGYYIILVNVYFFYKSAATVTQFAIALIRMREVRQINWGEKLEGLRNIPREIASLESQEWDVSSVEWKELSEYAKFPHTMKYPDGVLKSIRKLPGFLQKLIFYREKTKTLRYIRHEIETLRELQERKIVHPDELRHVVIIPHAKEPYKILKETLQILKDQTFNSKQISVVLGAEAADPEGKSKSEKLKKEFEQYFDHIWVTNHVLGEGEIVGKSSNMAWAGSNAVKEIKKLGWDLKKVTITSCDADSKLPEDYFDYVSYLYLTVLDSEYKFFNGAMVFYNNIWRLPFYARVKNSMSSIYNVARMVRTDKLFPFSTYTTSYWMIDQIGYWAPDVTPEDYHLFFKALFHFQNKVECVPLYIKIMSDAAEGHGHIDTIKNNYQQERRWAWGVSDDGWVLQTLLKGWRKNSIKVKYMALHVIFDHVMGIAGAAIIAFGANIPLLINSPFKQSVFGARLPGVSEGLIRITLVFMIGIVLLDYFFFKPKPEHNPWWRPITRLLEWFALPIASMFMSLIPGIEAHTRLLFGRHLEYYVTKKYDEEGKTPNK